MNTLLRSAPLEIADTAIMEMELSDSEKSEIWRNNFMPRVCRPNGKPMPQCQKLVRIGLFFDGTNNNRDRDEPIQGHTNVVKLFNAHSDFAGKNNLMQPGCYRYYIPGVGTRFPENREWTETADGKAMGKGGQARILETLRLWEAKAPDPSNRYQYRAWTNFQKAKASNPQLQAIMDNKKRLKQEAETARFNGRIGKMETIQAEAAFTPEEIALLTKGRNGEPIFPILTDAEAKELRDSLITTQTMTRREGGGYLVPRFVFLNAINELTQHQDLAPAES